MEEVIDQAKSGKGKGVATQIQRRNPLENSGSDSDEASLMMMGNKDLRSTLGQGGVNIFYHAGLIDKTEIVQFKKVLFRASRGKVLCKICDESPIDYSRVDPSLLKQKSQDQYVFVLVY